MGHLGCFQLLAITKKKKKKKKKKGKKRKEKKRREEKRKEKKRKEKKRKEEKRREKKRKGCYEHSGTFAPVAWWASFGYNCQEWYCWEFR
jgi:hypothetical protein